MAFGKRRRLNSEYPATRSKFELGVFWWAGHVARMEEGRGVHKVLVWKPEGKRPLGRPRCRWEDNIKMDLQEVGRGLGTGWGWLRIGTVGGRLGVR